MKFENVTMGAIHGMDYVGDSSISSKKMCESPVLDLSCKKSLPPSPTSDYEEDVSPLRETAYLEHQQETNNNNKHIDSYQHSPSQEHDGSKSLEGSTHNHSNKETSSLSSPTHERKSPFENRVYIMTPPSESDSPKKAKFEPVYDENHHAEAGENRTHPGFPMLPMNIAMPVPINMPSVLPALLSQSNINASASQIQIPTSPINLEVSSQLSTSSEETKKAPRPFKAYPKDPLSISLGLDMICDQELKKAFSDFRSRMLDSVKRTSEGTNIKMRRASKSPMLPSSLCDDKDTAYWERRRKNNEAAKRSRDARRAKEDEIAIRAAFLEQEYIRLKYENAVLRDENTKFKSLLYRH